MKTGWYFAEGIDEPIYVFGFRFGDIAHYCRMISGNPEEAKLTNGIIFTSDLRPLQMEYAEVADPGHDLAQAYRLLRDLQETAYKRGDKFGACDCIDNLGNPYPSSWAARIFEKALRYVCHADHLPAIGED